MKRLLSLTLFAAALAATLVSCKKEPVVLNAPSISGVVPAVNSAEVSWNAVDQATTYVLQLKASGGEWAEATSTSSTSTTLTGLSASTDYEVRVKAQGGEGTSESAYSAAYKFTTLTPAPDALATPAITSVTPGTDSAEVAWSEVAGASSYQLQLKAAGAEFADAATASASPATLSNLTPATEYEVRVKALASDGRVSEFSAAYKFNTNAAAMSYPLTITKADDFVKWINEMAGLCEPSDVTTLAADIDLTGKEIISVPVFNGQFDGAGKTIKGLSAPLFTELGETAVVKNVVVDATSALNWNEAIPDMMGYAFIACKSSGKILNCSVAGSIKVKSGEAERIYCAGIVGESLLGYVEGCKFTGSIDVELTNNSKSCSSIAGVAARVGHADKEGQVIVKDCVNEGNIKFVFSGPSKGMQKFGIGGVVGQTPSVKEATTNHGIVEGCTNKGNIEWEYPAGGSGSYPAVGGVAGIIEGQLKNANNYGKISYKGGFDVAATDASIGGVAGYVTRDASDCHNFGIVTTDSAFAGGTSLAQSGGNTSFSTFGGVFGNAGPFAADATYCGDQGITIENCTNEGDVNLKCYMINSGGPQMCFGGVVGASSANMKNCHNKKPVYIKTQCKTMNAGGVCGYLEANMDDCSNSGAITLDGVSADNPNVATTQAYFGGIFGMVTKGSTVNNVKNSGAVLFKDAITCDGVLSYVGGIGGSYKGSFILSNAENSATVTSESASPICLGGLCGAYNGQISNSKNSGKVAYKNSYISPTDGKAAEVGGLVGYANAYFDNCENTGDVTCAPAGGFAGGLIGSHGSNVNEPVIEHKGCKVNCKVDGDAVKGSVLGKFRYAPKSDFAQTAVAFGTEDSPFTISGGAAELPVVGQPFGHIVECLAAKAFWYGDKKYPLVKLDDGRWWMAAPLAYVPEGKTVSADPKEDAGIWYTYTTDGTNVAAKTDFTDGYLYDYPTAFGVAQDAITYGTRDEYKAGTNVGNFREFEGVQGICPPGWYIPTRPDFLKLVGASNKDDSLPENPETAAVEDATAVYWDPAYKGAKIPTLNAAGWNWSFLGVRSKTSTAQEGAYNKTATKATTCSVAEWVGLPALNQVMCSTPYMPNAAGNNVQYFCLMSAFTAANMEGKLSLSYGNYLHGMEVRCIRAVPEAK